LCGFLETDAVLALVGEVFRLIPLEPYFLYVNIVIIFLQLCNKAGGEAASLMRDVKAFSQLPWGILDAAQGGVFLVKTPLQGCGFDLQQL
jgi:hypothetical protein